MTPERRHKKGPYLSIGQWEIVACRALQEVGLGLVVLDLAVNGLDEPGPTVNDETGYNCGNDHCHGFISYNIARARRARSMPRYSA